MLRLTLMLSAVLGLAACETVEGFGRDVENAGEELEETSQETQAQI